MKSIERDERAQVTKVSRTTGSGKQQRRQGLHVAAQRAFQSPAVA